MTGGDGEKGCGFRSASRNLEGNGVVLKPEGMEHGDICWNASILYRGSDGLQIKLP